MCQYVWFLAVAKRQFIAVYVAKCLAICVAVPAVTKSQFIAPMHVAICVVPSIRQVSVYSSLSVLCGKVCGAA